MTKQKTRDNSFHLIVDDILQSSETKKMKQYVQHCDTDCYEHCMNVAYYSYVICKKLKLDYISAARAGMLHDFFLYDWRIKRVNKRGLHAYTHPKIALDNAKKIFSLSKKEQDIILKHMWPVTIKFPEYKESYIITIVDKFCAIKETYEYLRSTQFSQKLLKYAYLMINISWINKL